MEMKDNDDLTMSQAIVLCLLVWGLIAFVGLIVYGYYQLCEFILHLGSTF